MENMILMQLSAQEVRQILREEIKEALKNYQPSQKTSDEYELMTIQETAEFINLTVSSVYGLVHRKLIPHVKRGKRLIFEKQVIIEWLKSGRRKTMDEIKADANAYLQSHPTKR